MRTGTKSFLVVGFAVSAALHLILGPFVHREPTVAEEEPPHRLVVDRFLPTPPPRPSATPTPTPPPRLTAVPRPSRVPQPMRLRIHTLQQTAHDGSGRPEAPNAYASGDSNGAPGTEGTSAPAADGAATASAPPAATPSPTPTPVPKPTPTPLSCSRPNLPAATLRAVEPETPALAAQQGISGAVQVVVSLDAASRVTAARVQSSPSAVLNAAALGAARGSQFRTEVRDCVPVGADYVFTVEFTAQ